MAMLDNGVNVQTLGERINGRRAKILFNRSCVPIDPFQVLGSSKCMELVAFADMLAVDDPVSLLLRASADGRTTRSAPQTTIKTPSTVRQARHSSRERLGIACGK